MIALADFNCPKSVIQNDTCLNAGQAVRTNAYFINEIKRFCVFFGLAPLLLNALRKLLAMVRQYSAELNS